MKTTHRLIKGDSRNLSRIKDKSVHLIITSPPYWQLKDYGNDGQIGFHDSYESYINNLNAVWAECYRVLHDGCRLCINIGDQFARSVYYGRYKVIPIRTEIIRFCETLGMDYMGAVIWQKQTTMNTTGGGAVMGSFPYPRNGILKIDYEFILIFKKQGKAPVPTIEQKKLSEMSKEEWNTFFASHWNFGGAKQDGHIAVFPEELPRRLIKMFSFAGETVFDPFMGSGTTALAARNLQRNSIGYEINSDFRQYYEQKVVSASLFEDAEYSFEQDDAKFDINNKMRALPYMFNDPHKMDSKIDIKQLQFGSKIDKSSKEREEYFSVKEIISPNLILLNTGLVVKLIGITPDANVSEQAIEYIKGKTKGRKVYMRFDDVKYDDNNNLLCYLYLDNKTFINAHLLKNKLAMVDTKMNYKYKLKFMAY
ncbi:MAG: site-specific DNA-methyltransferase [Paludibacter sp.]|nr:site-specific DNA-methyltransferase [Bacteroidales bacterium]MCM1069286.1 site-specific DNA-methyltransferase [Prevotella sp.]MCM1353731.1 site-specific DNA-methyltransferase [Bacteroides sp.]MCM1442201.1 site-specific DNA-methyltransferase [Muribaculum sp.]MCM1482163.1 site-specific DNA-methyltransferase [Paludibacter sp.]